MAEKKCIYCPNQTSNISGICEDCLIDISNKALNRIAIQTIEMEQLHKEEEIPAGLLMSDV